MTSRLAITLACLACMACGAPPPEPINKVVVMIDGSGSYKSRQAEAVERAVALLDTLSRTKLHRWESATDSITLISLDALPEVLWTGTLRELKEIPPDDWTARFRARTDYARCTDVTAAFRLAARRLEGNPRFVKKYLCAFTDLIHEPPTASLKTAAPPQHLPPADFPWTAFQEVSVSVFWTPPDQKLRWQRAAHDHGLSGSFALYTTSESAEVQIAPPPRPTVEQTEEERQAIRDRLSEGLKSIVVWGGILAVVVVGGAAALGLIVSRTRRPRAGSAPRPPARPVPPLPGRPPFMGPPRRPAAPPGRAPRPPAPPR